MQPAATATVEEPGRVLGFEELYEKFASFVRSLVLRLTGPGIEPDDLCQEVWLVALRRLEAARLESPRAWLCRIVLNTVGNARRRHRIRRLLGLEYAPRLDDRRTPEALTEARELTRCVYECLDAMSEKKRTVFVLFEMSGMTGQEISEALGCPLPTIHSRLHHARREFLATFQEASHGRRDGNE